MYSSLLLRSTLHRNVVSYSARRFASRAPPPPLTIPPKAPGQNPTPRSEPPGTKSSVGSQAELESTTSAQPLSSLPSLDFAPGEEPREERTGARSSKDSLSSIERKRRLYGRVSLGALLLGLGLQTWFMGRELDDEDLKEFRLKREEAPTSRWDITALRFKGIFNTFTEPIWPELLPPPLPAPHQKPYTLLVSVDDLLVTSTWDRQHGWRTAKRPGVDYFLAYLSQFYEIVIFTTQYHYTALPVIEKLDPYQFFITYKLFRDATRSINGAPVKDISYLNRDLSKVIMLDAHPEHVSAQPENAIIVPKWTGNSDDRGLVAMIPFLESIGIYKPPDVRPILQAYHGKDIPVEYAKKEAEAKQKHIEEWEHRHGLASGGFTFSKLFGGGEKESSPIPPTYLEQKRREAQQLYKEEKEYIATNKEHFERLIKEEQEAMAKQMPNTFWGAAGAVLGPPPPGALQPDGQNAQDIKIVVDQPRVTGTS